MRWCHQDGPSLSVAAPFSRQLRHRSCLAAPRGGAGHMRCPSWRSWARLPLETAQGGSLIIIPPCKRGLLSALTRDPQFSLPGLRQVEEPGQIAVIAMSSRLLHRQLPPEIDVPLRGMVSHEGQGLLQRPSIHPPVSAQSVRGWDVVGTRGQVAGPSSLASMTLQVQVRPDPTSQSCCVATFVTSRDSSRRR